MGKLLPLALFLAILPLGPLRAAGPFTVNTTTDAHSVGYSGTSGAPGSTAPTDSSGQYSLRSVLEYASTVGGTTMITLPTGTYNLTLGDLIAGTTANTTIYLNGAGAATTIIHQSATGEGIFTVNYIGSYGNIVFNLSSVTLTGGNKGQSDPDGFGSGGAILAGAPSGNALNLTNVVFNSNFCSPVSGTAYGGAVEMYGGGNLNVKNCTFLGNNAAKGGGTGFGGAIDFNNAGSPGNAVISDSYFSNNIAPSTGTGSGGGGINLVGGTSGNFTINGCTFANNSSSGSGTAYGGAIYLQTGNLTGSGNRFRGNVAASGGAVDAAGTTTLINNWWGANGGPNSAGADTTVPTTSGGILTFSPWIELKTSINQNPVQVGNSATVTASFLVNSAGQSISPASIPPLIGLPVTWTDVSGGTLQGSQATIQAGGTATTTFTATTVGSGTVEAIVDGIVAGGDTNATVNFTVGQKPAVTPPANVVTNATNGVCLLPAISFAATASGFPTPVISYQLDGGTITSPTTFPLGTNVVICTATNSIGTNSSNFNVTVLPGTAPQLKVVKSGGNVFVSWPTNFNCYLLQTASALASNHWQNFSGIVGTDAGNFIVTNGVSDTNNFFRLAH